MKPWPRIVPRSAGEKRLLLISLSLALLTLAADQLSKFWFVKHFSLFQTRPIFDGWLNFTYVRNTGAAWSMFSGQVWPLLTFGLLVAAGIVIWFRKLAENCPERYVALMLVLSGIVGNSIDRCFRKAVVDFIHVHYLEIWHYPVFNIADMAICCGIGIFMLSGFLRKNLKTDESDADGER